MNTISFVIPVYNEKDSLKELYRQIVENIPSNNDYEIVFVSDGSTDGSNEIVRELNKVDAKVHLIAFRKNFGKSAALQAGFRNVSGNIVITMDSDLQDDPKEIPAFISKINEGYDMVSGWKFNRQDPAEKRWPSKLFNYVTSKSSGINLHDFDCGFKAYKKEVIDCIDVYGEFHRYIPVLVQRKGFSITEIPVHHNKREHEKSKYGFERYFHGFCDFATSTFLLRYFDTPMYLFGGVGSVIGLIGVLICLYMTVLHFMGTAVSGRPLLMLGVLLIIVGIQMFCTGILSNMILESTFRARYNENHIKEKF